MPPRPPTLFNLAQNLPLNPAVMKIKPINSTTGWYLIRILNRPHKELKAHTMWGSTGPTCWQVFVNDVPQQTIGGIYPLGLIANPDLIQIKAIYDRDAYTLGGEKWSKEEKQLTIADTLKKLNALITSIRINNGDHTVFPRGGYLAPTTINETVLSHYFPSQITALFIPCGRDFTSIFHQLKQSNYLTKLRHNDCVFELKLITTLLMSHAVNLELAHVIRQDGQALPILRYHDGLMIEQLEMTNEKLQILIDSAYALIEHPDIKSILATSSNDENKGIVTQLIQQLNELQDAGIITPKKQASMIIGYIFNHIGGTTPPPRDDTPFSRTITPNQ